MGAQTLCGAPGGTESPASGALGWCPRPEAREGWKGLTAHRPGEGNPVCCVLTPVPTARALKRRDPMFALAAGPDGGRKQRSAEPGKVGSSCSRARQALLGSPLHRPLPHYLSPTQDMTARPGSEGQLRQGGHSPVTPPAQTHSELGLQQGLFSLTRSFRGRGCQAGRTPD